MDQLLREGNPPAGQLASPKPQYKKPGVDEYAPVEGQHGAPYATIKDANGNVISPATETTLEQVKAELEAVKAELAVIKANQTSGDQKVQLSGTLTELEQARELLEAISGKDFASQTTLEAVLTELANVKSELEAIKANQLSGDQKVQLSGTIVRDVLGYFSTRSAGQRYYFGATGPSHAGGTLRPLDIRGFKKISIYFLNGSPTFATRGSLRVTFHRTLDVQDPANAFEVAPRYEFDNVPANGSFRLLLTSDLSDLAGTPPDGLAIRYLPNLVGLVFSYDQPSAGADGNKIILFSGVR